MHANPNLDVDPADAWKADDHHLRERCMEYQFQIELLQTERDAAWTQARKGRGQLDALQSELAALRAQAEAEAAELRRSLEALQAEREDAERRLQKYRTNSDSHIDLSGPPSTRNNLTPETFGLEHTDLRLGEADELRAAREECDQLRSQMAEIKRGWERFHSDREILAAGLENLASRERALQEHLEIKRGELAARESALQHEVRCFEEQRQHSLRSLEAREADLRRRERALRLQESELRELARITENECANERARLTEERLRIARLREALRLETRQQEELRKHP